MTSVLGSFRLFLAAAILVAVAIVLVTPSGNPTSRRIAHLESLVKCPACKDLSVAQSNAASSIAVRVEIGQRVRAGESDTRILTALERQYGVGILLSPPAGGLSDVLWIVPTTLIALGALTWFRLGRRS